MLIKVLEGEGGKKTGLKVTARKGYGRRWEGKSVWVFIGAEDEKIQELVDKEK